MLDTGTGAYLYTFVISVHIQSLTWMISVDVKEILRKIMLSNHLFSYCRMQNSEKTHKIEEKGVKVACADIHIFAHTQQLPRLTVGEELSVS